jgi:hypothetical protein
MFSCFVGPASNGCLFMFRLDGSVEIRMIDKMSWIYEGRQAYVETRRVFTSHGYVMSACDMYVSSSFVFKNIGRGLVWAPRHPDRT